MKKILETYFSCYVEQIRQEHNIYAFFPDENKSLDGWRYIKLRNVNLRELNFDFPNHLEQFKKLLDNLFWEINFFNHKEFNSLIADSDRNFELDHSSAPNLDYDYFTDDEDIDYSGDLEIEVIEYGSYDGPEDSAKNITDVQSKNCPIENDDGIIVLTDHPQEKIDNIFYLPLVSIKCIKYEQFYVRHQSGEIELYEDEIDSESIKSQLEL